MLPQDLKPEQFAGYPPQARKLVLNYLGTLQQLPLGFVPGLLRELIDYDFKFPAERKARETELAALSSLSAAQLKDWFQELGQIRLSPQLEQFDWAGAPAQFIEQLSAYLWSTHQLDAFRKASNDYAVRLRSAVPPDEPPVPRLGITVVGQGVAPYAHWYIDGGEEADHDPALTCVSYSALEPIRSALLRKMRAEVDRPGMGPEALRTILAETRLSELGVDRRGNDTARDEVLDRFRVSLLTEGSGTQVFSTTFAQWAAREALRRAQPLTLLVRFAPRQKPMSELLSASPDRVELDYIGSLIDADMGAYYNLLNQQRLPGAEHSSFLVWFEGHGQALAIGPSMPRGTVSGSAPDLGQLLSWTM